MIKFALTKNIADNIFLYYGNHNESSVIFHNEFNKLKNTFNGKLKVVNYLSQPKYLNNCIKGRITKNETINQLNQLDSQIISDADFFVCGPEGMMKNVIEGLEEFKISSNNIHTEYFSFGILDYDEEIELIEREVTILISGEQHKIKIEAGNTILQQALQEKIHIPNSCNYGSCGTCKAKLISGKIMLAAHTALSQEEREKGFCLTCIGYPVSENIVILYENPFED